MTRITEETFADTYPAVPQPPPWTGLEPPFHPQEYLTTYLNAEEVSKMLHMGIEAVRKLLHSGKIRSAFIGRRYLCTRADVGAYLQNAARNRPKTK